MLEQILCNLYRLEIPLPGNPLKSVNSYVVKGQGRNLIIDTGLNRQECRDAMLRGLNELSVDLNKTDFFITHMHADHAALVPSLIIPGTRAYMSAVDAKAFSSFFNIEQRVEILRANALRNGLPADAVQQVIKNHPAHKYAPERSVAFTIVEENARISIGDSNFVCIATPGHTMGHMCLYEPEKKILFSGDHILGDITPVISNWFGGDNVLAEFLSSLKKIAALPVGLVLPGHRNILSDCCNRIEKLIEHHRDRAAEVYAALANGPLTAYGIAARMTWGVTGKSFSEFPGPQKWFATGETIAHLRYLESEGYIKGETQGTRIIYSR